MQYFVILQNSVSYQDTPIKDKFSEHNYLDSDQQPSWDLSEVMLVTFGALSQQGKMKECFSQHIYVGSLKYLCFI